MKTSMSSILIKTFVLLICLMTVSTIGFADTEANNQGNKTLYRVSFDENTPSSLLRTEEMFSTITSNIEQVVFTGKFGNETYTIGYYVPNGTYTYSKMHESINSEIKSIKKDLQEANERSVQSVSFDDLSIKRIEISSYENEKKVNAVVSELKNKNATVTKKSSRLPEVKNEISNTMMVNQSIDGSYHRTVTNGHVFRIDWYNQFTSTTVTCNRSISEPHMGDGNSRYKAGHQWFPNLVRTEFTTDVSNGKNRTKLSYFYASSEISNLKVDNNETLEMEVVFYNSPNASVIANRGCSYQETGGKTWSTNQPNAYLDTTFSDGTHRCFCVGVDDASELSSGTWYNWSITSDKGSKPGYANDGRFKVNAQRGYRDGTSGTWGVFAEEHEGTIVYGVDSSKGQNWVPSVNAWLLASQGTIWSCNTVQGPISHY